MLLRWSSFDTISEEFDLLYLKTLELTPLFQEFTDFLLKFCSLPSSSALIILNSVLFIIKKQELKEYLEIY